MIELTQRVPNLKIGQEYMLSYLVKTDDGDWEQVTKRFEGGDSINISSTTSNNFYISDVTLEECNHIKRDCLPDELFRL